jgi:NitT/TauT family transport system substrate-binding protein
MHNYVYKVVLFSFILLIVIFPACSKEGTVPERNTELTELKVTQSDNSLLNLPLYLANDLEYFKREGLKILVETAVSQEMALQNLLSENTSLVLGSPVTAFYHLQQENVEPVVFLAQAASKSGYYLLARNGSTPFTWQNLKGKVVIGYNNGELPQIIFEYLLKQNNLQPLLNVHIIQNLPYHLIEGAFLAGTGHYVLAMEPLASSLEKKANSQVSVVIDLPSDNIVTAVIMTTPDFVNNNPLLCQGFINGFQEGLKWINEHTPEEIVEAGKKFFPAEDEKVLLRAISRYKTMGCWPLSTNIDDLALQKLQDIMLENKEINSLNFSISKNSISSIQTSPFDYLILRNHEPPKVLLQAQKLLR